MMLDIMHKEVATMMKLSELSDIEIGYHKALPYWTPVEAAALISGVNPKALNPDKLPEKVKNVHTALVRAIEKDEKPLSFTKVEDGIMLDPFSFIRWAKWIRKYKIPEYFRLQSVTVEGDDGDLDKYLSGEMSDDYFCKKAKVYYQWRVPVDMEALSAANNELPLNNPVNENTITLDLESNALPKELKMALNAYKGIYLDGWIDTQKEIGGPLKVLEKWLHNHYPALKENKERTLRLCRVLNKKKSGGQPKL
nr:hypothetical protein [Desulfobacula sp.]